MPPEGVGNQVPWRREVVAVSAEFARAYRARVIFGPFAPARLKEASALEGEIGLPIPPAYRSFLEMANGGTLAYSVRVPPGPEGQPISFCNLYRLGRDKQGAYGWGTLLGEYRQLPHSWLAGQLPVTTLLPVACTGGGDQLFLDLTPDRYGQVVGMLHGLPEWTGLHTRNLWGVLAADFDAYLDSLFIEPQVAEDVWSDHAHQDPADPRRRVVQQWLDSGLPGWQSMPWAVR
jgi:SMI1 / KNR4 family (SUKH-1)